MKRSPVLTSVFALLIVFLATSCFQIREKIFFKSDGSGSFELTMDMSQMMAMMQGFADSMGEDMESEEEGESQDTTFNAQIPKLEALAGITKVTTSSSKEGVSTLKFDFKSIDVLNQALNVVYETEKNPEVGEVKFFTMEKNKVVRHEGFDLFKEITKSMKDEMGAQEDEDFDLKSSPYAAMMSGMGYTTEYQFDKKISKYSNKAALLSQDKKSITISYMFMEEDQPETLANEISF